MISHILSKLAACAGRCKGDLQVSSKYGFHLMTLLFTGAGDTVTFTACNLDSPSKGTQKGKACPAECPVAPDPVKC